LCSLRIVRFLVLLYSCVVVRFIRIVDALFTSHDVLPSLYFDLTNSGEKFN
jgi:hypothetical protein